MIRRTRRTRAQLVVALALVALCATPAAATPLRFVRGGKVVASLDLADVRGSCPAETVAVDDPNYGGPKRFLACPLAPLLVRGFGLSIEEIAGHEFVLRALDGYEKPAAGKKLVEKGAYLAFADADLTKGEKPAWQRVGPRAADPGPYYVVWSEAHQREERGYPWPYQLSEIAAQRVEERWPNALPRGEPSSSKAWDGFEVFRTHCIACHAMNREGGRIGPDLNVPQSIVEYRPVDQIRAFIRDPRTFRYSTMPAHRYLADADLDHLIAYFRSMKTRKHDPEAKAH